MSVICKNTGHRQELECINCDCVCHEEPASWMPIETAPRNGTSIQAKIPGHGNDNIIAWHEEFIDASYNIVGGWVFTSDQEPPSCWSDGVCWAVNEDGVASIFPTEWKPLL